jgi:DNA repair exonuclease SbcCD nuclease subunit
MTRVIHTGDTHIGYRQYHSPERRQDFLDAFQQVVDDAIREDVDAVVHAGDLFHDRRPDLPDIQGTVAALRELADADIPFLAVVGNHETKRDGQWLDLFEDLGLTTRLGSTPEIVGDIAFYGLDFVTESQRDTLEYEYEPTEEADYAALVSHGLFEPFAHADWDTERLLEESTVDLDAVLLGDNHAPGKRELLDTWVTYCGSTERASASERDDRGYNIVTVDDEFTITRRAVADTREFRFVDIELAEGEGTDRVRERVRQYDVEDAVVIVTIEGDGETVTPASVEELALDDGALIARVNDRREIDREEDVSVSFADPDDAVRERLRDLGLSPAARDIDETVRESKVADSNVRETVESLVRERADEGLSAFESADDDEAGGSPADSAAGESGADPDDAETDSASDSESDHSDAESQHDQSDAESQQSDPDTAQETDSQRSVEEFL